MQPRNQTVEPLSLVVFIFEPARLCFFRHQEKFPRLAAEFYSGAGIGAIPQKRARHAVACDLLMAPVKASTAKASISNAAATQPSQLRGALPIKSAPKLVPTPIPR